MALFGPSKIFFVTVLLNHPVFQNLSQSGLLLLPDLVNTLVSYHAGLDGGDRDLKKSNNILFSNLKDMIFLSPSVLTTET